MAGQAFMVPNLKIATFWGWKQNLEEHVESDAESDGELDDDGIALFDFMQSNKGKAMRKCLFCWIKGEVYVRPNMMLAIFAEMKSAFYDRNSVCARTWNCPSCKFCNRWTLVVCQLCDANRIRYVNEKKTDAYRELKYQMLSPSEIPPIMHDLESCEEAVELCMAFSPEDASYIIACMTKPGARKM